VNPNWAAVMEKMYIVYDKQGSTFRNSRALRRGGATSGS
jgi:hypothetical protein